MKPSLVWGGGTWWKQKTDIDKLSRTEGRKVKKDEDLETSINVTGRKVII